MMKIWTEDGFVGDDPWVVESDERRAGANERAILGYSEFVDGAGEGMVGVLVNPVDSVAKLKPQFDRIALVAIAFPAFNDGRGFSHASLLRRLGFGGEIRAVGDVLIDQIPLMQRCGFDSFAVTNATALRRLEEGKLPGIDLHYQPAARPAHDPETYRWRRVAYRAA
jgi:uncharacterized protein (DUF934 family)